MRHWRVGVLLAVLVGLLAWVWISDRAGPAYPNGRFGELVCFAGFLVALVYAAASIRKGV